MASERSIFMGDELDAGEMGNHKDLSDSDKEQTK